MKIMLFLEVKKTIVLTSGVFALEKRYYVIVKDGNDKNIRIKHAIFNIYAKLITIIIVYLIINALYIGLALCFAREYFAEIAKLQVMLNILLLILLKIIIRADDEEK